MVEIHAGDTFVFAPAHELATKSQREDDAIEKLSDDWPDFRDIALFAKGYKDKVDEEAKFVKAVDKILPVLMVNLGEKDSFWHRHRITLEMEIENKHSIEVSDHIAPYYRKLIDWITETGYLYKP